MTCSRRRSALHLELEVVETGTFAVETDLDVPADRSNLIVRAFERLHPADGFTFRISSQIPLSGGLGSSAAAIVAGLLAADHLFELDADVPALARELEGHPDNVGAALAGGFVICDGDRIHRFEPPMGLEGVLVVPHEPVRTAEARGGAARRSCRSPTPCSTSRRRRSSCSALQTADWDLIAGALGDRLHQPYRAHLYPRSAELLDSRPGARGARGDDLRRWADGAGVDALRADRRRAEAPREGGRGLGGRDPRAV